MTTEKVDIVTKSSMNKGFILPEQLNTALMQIEACRHVKIHVSFNPDDNKVYVNILHPDECIKEIVMIPGDVFEFDHEFSVDITNTVRKDHIFPLSLKFKGEKYLLNRTKNNKLLLTK